VEGVEDFASDVALEASHDLVFGFAFSYAAGDVVAGRVVAAHAYDEDDVQSPLFEQVGDDSSGRRSSKKPRLSSRLSSNARKSGP
jgi:hypothetical protein